MAQVLEHTMPPPASPRAPWPDRVRVSLLVAWLVLLVGVWGAGEREVSVQDLDATVVAGAVHTVEVSPGPRGTGRIPQQAHWRQGWWRYVVRVDHVRRGPGSRTPEDLAARVRSINPDVRVVRVADRYSDASVLGRRVPQWVNELRFLLGLLAGGLLLFGPEPWRANRYAWFWMMTVFGLQTLGVLAFLALSGPTPLVPRPAPGARRLKGGWAFVIAVVLSGIGAPNS